MIFKGRILNQNCPIDKWHNPLSGEWSKNV